VAIGGRFRDFSPGRGKKFISAAICSEVFRGPCSVLGLINGYQGFFSGVKRPVSNTEHFSSFRAKFRNEWSSASTHLYVSMAWKETGFLV